MVVFKFFNYNVKFCIIYNLYKDYRYILFGFLKLKRNGREGGEKEEKEKELSLFLIYYVVKYEFDF